MSKIRYSPNTGVPDPSLEPSDAQTEQDGAAFRQVPLRGGQGTAPVGSAAPAQGAAGVKHNVPQTGSMTAARRMVLGAFTTSQWGPDLISKDPEAGKTPAKRLEQQKRDAAVIATLIPQPGSVLSEADMFNKEQARESVKHLYSLITSYIQQHQDMLNQIGQR